MNFDDYQKEAHDFAQYGDNPMYPVLGICGEAGEIAEKTKKLIRDKGMTSWSGLEQEDRKALAKEIGDCGWYLSELATCLGLSLSDVARGNLTKLSSRRDRGVLGGSGDNR